MLSRAQNTFHHNPRLRGPVSSTYNGRVYRALVLTIRIGCFAMHRKCKLQQ